MVTPLRLALLLVTLVAVSCSQQPQSLTLDQYFDEIEVVAATYRQDVGDAGAKFDAEVQKGLEELQAGLDQRNPQQVAEYENSATRLVAETTLVLFRDRAVILGRLAEQLESLVPPAEAQAAHEEIITSARLAVDGIPVVMTKLASIESAGDISAAVAGSPYADAQPRFAAACTGLVTLATQHNLALGLACPL